MYYPASLVYAGLTIYLLPLALYYYYYYYFYFLDAGVVYMPMQGLWGVLSFVSRSLHQSTVGKPTEGCKFFK
jgi:hypothetical protein